MGYFQARTFAMMPSESMLVNVGRTKHVVEANLIKVLDSGQLAYAALDALWYDPLPPAGPMWLHPKVTIMPHVARRPTVAQLVTEIAASIRSVQAGERFCRKSTKRPGISGPLLCRRARPRPMSLSAPMLAGVPTSPRRYLWEPG
jgi:phosphoglycerate dehydrogenase-like enzyme